MHAVDAMITTASESMASFDDADAPFTAYTPALAAPKPGLPLVGPSARGFRPAPGPHDPSHAAIGGGLLVARGAEATIARREMWRTTKGGVVTIQRRVPQRHIRGASGVHLVRGDDL